MTVVIIDIRISADEYLRYYSGSARQVLARARDGRKIQFPANILQRYVSHSGIHGSFRISFSQAGKFESIEKLGEPQ